MSLKLQNSASPTPPVQEPSYNGGRDPLLRVEARKFGRYVLIGKLGAGGMAEANLGVVQGKAGFRKLVVIKRLHRHLESEPEFVRMFLDEARLGAAINHPNCIQTIEVGVEDDQHFMAMEYLRGQPLDRILRLFQRLNLSFPIPIACRLIVDVLDGLQYIHTLQGFDGQPLSVVHRDVTPSNLFVTYQGTTKLLDFGIASASTNLAETEAGVIKGKYAYISPEQIKGVEVDGRSDIFGVGMVLWEVLAGSRMYPPGNDLTTLQRKLRDDSPPPSSRRQVPEELDWITLKALAREPDDRFQTAQEMRDALLSYILGSGEPCDHDDVSAFIGKSFSAARNRQQKAIHDCLQGLPVSPSCQPGSSEVRPRSPSEDAVIVEAEKKTKSMPKIPSPMRSLLKPEKVDRQAVPSSPQVRVSLSAEDNETLEGEVITLEGGVVGVKHGIRTPVVPAGEVLDIIVDDLDDQRNRSAHVPLWLRWLSVAVLIAFGVWAMSRLLGDDEESVSVKDSEVLEPASESAETDATPTSANDRNPDPSRGIGPTEPGSTKDVVERTSENNNRLDDSAGLVDDSASMGGSVKRKRRPRHRRARQRASKRRAGVRSSGAQKKSSSDSAPSETALRRDDNNGDVSEKGAKPSGSEPQSNSANPSSGVKMESNPYLVR